MDKYIEMAKQLGLENAVPTTGDQIFFDPRAIYKCRWGCEYGQGKASCQRRDMPPEQLQQVVRAYDKILVLHDHDVGKLYKAALKIERQAFIDGHHFAAMLGNCNFCKDCKTKQGRECISPQNVRPCPEGNGMDVFKTVRNLGLPIQTLKDKDEVQNRYAFVMID